MLLQYQLEILNEHNLSFNEFKKLIPYLSNKENTINSKDWGINSKKNT